MTKRRVTKLFAVVALATSTPAAAGPQHDHGNRPEHVDVRERARDPWAPRATATPEPTPAQAVELTRSVLALLGVQVPRQLRTGAPACGNVSAKSPRRSACEPGT